MWLAGDASALTDSMSHQPLTSEQLSHTQQWRKQKKHLKATVQQKRKESPCIYSTETQRTKYKKPLFFTQTPPVAGGLV